MTTTERKQAEDYSWFLENEDNLRLEFQGRYVVVKGKKVIDSDISEIDAIKAAVANGEKLGTFIVQFVAPIGSPAPEVRFTSRVFA